MNKPTIDCISENALLLTWRNEININQHKHILQLQKAINIQLANVLIDSVASYHCLMVYYHFQQISTEEMIDEIQFVISDQQKHGAQQSSLSTSVYNEVLRIPVYYDLEQEWDLKAVAQDCNLTINEVINYHSQQRYHSFALGFTPGFCYLASLPAALRLPRKSTPRQAVPEGAVAIAEQQTAIYPHQSPGGWHIIGQTPLAMYQCDHQYFQPTIKLGQAIEFYPISKQEFIMQSQSKNASKSLGFIKR